VSRDIRTLDPSDEEGLRACVSIINAVTPESPTSVEEVHWADATYPGGVRFLAYLEGQAVGTASVGRIYMHEPSFERYWLSLQVRREARRRGLGTALWGAASGIAREAGKTGLQTSVSEAQTDGVAFLLHRGFEIIGRDKMARLDLRGLDPPVVRPPAGFALTTLADRPELESALHAVAVEAYADIPATDAPIAAGSFDEFRARDLRRDGIPADALAIAVDSATGDVAGWASLMFVPGSTTVAWHDMTAVARAWRGRGVATVLKHATIAWAIGHGLEALETGNDEENAPMRAINARLGYRPLPDELSFRGPLSPDR
jgi:GNAT superfamily N-acetyltransferase